jgi:hypothetical protein
VISSSTSTLTHQEKDEEIELLNMKIKEIEHIALERFK